LPVTDWAFRTSSGSPGERWWREDSGYFPKGRMTVKVQATFLSDRHEKCVAPSFAEVDDEEEDDDVEEEEDDEEEDDDKEEEEDDDDDDDDDDSEESDDDACRL
jgi:hypothetical protein